MSSKKSLVSIIIPVHNAAKFLNNTVETIEKQTYREWEAIFVDDYSADDSLKTLKRVQSRDRKIVVLENEKNIGAAETRNRGIAFARGRYICFLDADDLWSPEKIEKQLRFMERKGCAFSFTGYEFANEKGMGNGHIVAVPETMTYRQALRNTAIFTSTVMFDMSKLGKEDIKMPDVPSEDTATWWRILNDKKIKAYGLNENLSLYRRSSGTLSANKLEAVRRVWNLYRNEQGLSRVESAVNFVFYAVNTIRRRI